MRYAILIALLFMAGCDTTSREMNHLIGYFDIRATWIPREAMMEGEEHHIYYTFPVKNMTLLECRKRRIELEREYRVNPRSGLGYYEQRRSAYWEGFEKGRVRFECVRTAT